MDPICVDKYATIVLQLKVQPRILAFVPHHHPLAAVFYGFIDRDKMRCPHAAADVRAALGGFQCVVSECGQGKGSAGPAHTQLYLVEPALRLLLDRSEMMCVPFPEDLIVAAYKDVCAIDPTMGMRDVAMYALPIIAMQTPILYVLCTSKVAHKTADADRVPAYVSSATLFAQYHLMLRAVLTMVATTGNNIETAVATVGISGPDDHVKRAFEVRNKALRDREAAFKLFMANFDAVWKRCESFIRAAREELRAALLAQTVSRDDALRTYCTRVINGLETHLMALLNVPRRWHKALTAVPAVPRTIDPELTREMDAFVVDMRDREIALRRGWRARSAQDTSDAAGQPAEPCPPMFAPAITDDDVSALNGPGAYNALLAKVMSGPVPEKGGRAQSPPPPLSNSAK